MSFLPGLMDLCTECRRHMLCVMGRQMHFCVLCHQSIDLELICMQGRNHDCSSNPPDTYCKAEWKNTAERICPYVVPVYPDLVGVVEEKILRWLGREPMGALMRDFDSAFYSVMHLSFGYLGYCDWCRDQWKDLISNERWLPVLPLSKTDGKAFHTVTK